MLISLLIIPLIASLLLVLLNFFFNIFFYELPLLSVTSDNQLLSLLLIRIKPSNQLFCRFAHTSTGSENTIDKFIKEIPLNHEGERLLLKNLNEIRSQSQEMTGFEYLQNLQNKFNNTLPFRFQSQYLEYLEQNKLRDIWAQVSAPRSRDINSSSFDLPKLSQPNVTNPFEKVLNFLSLNQNKNLSQDNEFINLSNKINDTYNNYTKSEEGKLIEVMGDGKIIIDITKLNELITKITNDLQKKVIDIKIEDFSLYLYGISNLMAYRGIIMAYDKGSKLDLKTFESENTRLEELKYMQNKRFLFSSVGAISIIISLNGILYLHKYLSNPANINVNSSSENNPKKALIFIFTYFKKLNIFIKLILIFIIIPIFIYSSHPYLYSFYLSYINFLNTNLFKIKIFISLVNVLIIIYMIIELLLINKYSKITEKPILNKYTPSCILKKINSLYKISQFSQNDKTLIIGFLYKNILFFTIILFIILISLLI